MCLAVWGIAQVGLSAFKDLSTLLCYQDFFLGCHAEYIYNYIEFHFLVYHPAALRFQSLRLAMVHPGHYQHHHWYKKDFFGKEQALLIVFVSI